MADRLGNRLFKKPGNYLKPNLVSEFNCKEFQVFLKSRTKVNVIIIKRKNLTIKVFNRLFRTQRLPPATKMGFNK
jgi:hypothetical protein